MPIRSLGEPLRQLALEQLAEHLKHNQNLQKLYFKYDRGFGTSLGKYVAEGIAISASLTNIDLSSNHLVETGYVNVDKVVGDEVIYEGRKMIVSKGKDSDNEIKMQSVQGIIAIADALCVSASLTQVLAF